MFFAAAARRVSAPAVVGAVAFSVVACAAARVRAAQTPPPPAALTVHLDRPGPAVSPRLYGLFFEEINHAGDGGLYAEMVRNRSFEDDASRPDGWSAVALGDAQVNLALDTSRPLNAQNPRALRLDISPSKDSKAGALVGVANEGYWGVALRRGEPYQVSFYARCDERFAVGKNGAVVSVRLMGANGTVYAGRARAGLGTAWKRFTMPLLSSETDPKARLVLSFDGTRSGSIYLDMVSLFPQRTFKNRPNGLRADLAGRLAAMKPAFVRFPGGCFVEGQSLASAFRWKDTVGPIEQRPGRASLWGYRSTEGLGYHEYLQMCEDLGAEPLLVVNCGMSHTDVEPMATMKRTWVQDALDAIEYANGPVTSKWGALRAKHGRAKPFNLRLLEIGNENGGPAYNERYALVYDAVRARYPHVKIIANEWGGRPTSRPFDIVDEHYYNNPDWFLANANRYDTYSRAPGAPKVYVGEYAVTQNAGLGNLQAALAEAAFMMGMERNSDVVEMASYAPLFVHVNDRKWNPDAIGFDSASSFGTPSYYVQQLFSLNRPDTIVPVTLAGAEPAARPAQAGQVGVGTWRTQAEFKNVQLTRPNGTPANVSQWRTVRGDWKQAENGVWRQTSEAENVFAVGGPSDSDYTLTLQARKLAGREGFLVLFRAKSDGDNYWWNIGGWNIMRHAVERAVGGGRSIVSGEGVPGSIETGRWYDIKIETAGSRVRCYLDNKLIHDFEEKPAPTLHAAAGRTQTGELIVKVVNAGDDAREADVNFARATAAAPVAFAPTARVTVLTGAAPTDENSLATPEKIAPRTETLSVAGPRLRYTFAPHSLTVLRLKEKR